MSVYDINKINFGGNTYKFMDGVALTQAEYDALSTAEKNNGTVYYITDGIQVSDYVGAIRVTTPSFSSLPQTYANSRMTSSHLLINTVLSNPAAQTSDWVITTNNGSITIDGATSGEGISGSTTATFDFVLGV